MAAGKLAEATIEYRNAIRSIAGQGIWLKLADAYVRQGDAIKALDESMCAPPMCCPMQVFS